MATALALSTASFGAPSSQASTELSKHISSFSQQKPQLPTNLLLQVPQDENEVVRVIVEMEEAPGIEEATKLGKRYKDLSETEQTAIDTKIKGKQNKVKENAKKKVKGIQFKQEFTTAFNGFSAEVTAKELENLADVEGVKAVYEALEYTRPVETPEMTSSKELIQAQLAWEEYNFKGEGMVIGVIDSGIDPSHRDFVLSEDTNEELESKEISKLVRQGKIEAGKYFSDKIPFGYNYMDDNTEVRDLGPGASMHGQHVSGTVGANGDESNGGIKGVAPESQILALKVFGNDPEFPSTFGDIYVKAIDDAIKLGADVINMSLGSTAGYQNGDSPEQQAVSRAQKNGMIVSISAGNSDMFGSGTWYPSTENQDYGLTGSPSVSKDSFGVASFENSVLAAKGFSYQVNGADAGEALYLLANDVEPKANTEFELVDAGFGLPEDFNGKDLSGKYALVSRGQIAFVDKGLNALNAGAAGIIVYNNAAGTINMASDPSITIPYMSALQTDGLAMKNELTAGNKVSVTFDGRIVNTANPEAGKMSSFTSWGPTPNLDFKPEITAPGGNIYSTLNNDTYGLMSGTSMAAPHVAGGSALVLERVDREFKAKGAKRSLLAKNLLMNTAKPIELTPGEYVSPRRQGAGIMQLANALETDVLVTNKETGEAKVALKEIENGKFEFTLNVENFGKTEKTYNVGLQLQSDAPVNVGGGKFVTISNDSRYGSYVFTEGTETSEEDSYEYKANFENSITLKGKESKELKFVVDASYSQWLKDYFTNGYFIDGFVTLTDATPTEEDEVLQPLVVPFFGFNGSWDDAPIFDNDLWEEEDTFWGFQGLYTPTANGLSPLLGKSSADDSVDPNSFAFSPNGDGRQDTVQPILSLMRNAKEFQVNVVDATGQVVRTLRNDYDLRKNYIASNPYVFNSGYSWDGKLNGTIAQDGQYKIQLKAKVDFKDAQWQVKEYSLYLDTTSPELYTDYDGDTQLVNLDIREEGSGFDRLEVVVDGKVAKTIYSTIETIDLNEFEGSSVQLVVWDVAGNSSSSQIVGESVDNSDSTTPSTPVEPDSTQDETWKSSYDAPVVSIKSPGFFSVSSQKNVVVTGQVTDNSEVVSVKVNGQIASFDGLNYSAPLSFKDGVHVLRVEALDDEGNETSVQRQIFVDTTPATISTKTKKFVAASNATSFELPVTVKDNFDEIRLYLNDSEIYYNAQSEPYGMTPFSRTTTLSVPLTGVSTTATVKAVDLAGNETEFKVTIDKSSKGKK